MEEETMNNGSNPPPSGMPDAKAVGRRIALARKEAGGMTQRDLADRLQVTQRTVVAYEAGQVVPFKHLDKIETAVSKPTGWLLYGDEALPNPTAILDKLDSVSVLLSEKLGQLNDRLEQLRQGAAALEARDGRDGRGDVVDDLNRLVELRYQDMVTEAEFAAAKALLFGLDRGSGTR
jgi:transcriptional regulator with XRE-family HTH domain